jgi:hypothetical protein
VTDPHWNIPAPPPPPRRPIEFKRVAIGFGIALAAHLLTLVPILFGFTSPDTGVGVTGAFIFLILQVLLFPTLITLGVVFTVRQDGGIGVGLLIGWAIGVLVSFGGCIALLNAGAAG